jgi:polyvinyl alcohol dehydrogenase (cytochrome)
MRFLFVIVLTFPALLSAQNGADIYKQRCASCHDAPAGRVPSFTTIRGMGAKAIYSALTAGVMRTQAAGLTTAQIFALIRYIGPEEAKPSPAAPVTPTCLDNDAAQFAAGALRGDSPRWDGWSPGAANTRFQSAAAAGLPAALVPKLKLKWAFNLGKATMARSQPAIVAGRLFIGTQTGEVYALDAETGCTRWGFQARTAIRSGVTFGDAGGTPAIFFGDTGAHLYALNAETGKLIWSVRPVDQFDAIVTATPRFYKGILYQPFSSFEEALGADPKYQCCTFRGSVVALDAATGKKIWQAFTIPEEAQATVKSPSGVQQYGPSGAGAWSNPTIDERAGVLYIATGNNYSDPPTKTSDAILAFELKTGKLLWAKQLTGDDVYNDGCATPKRTNCGHAPGPDHDFGQPPILVSLGGGKRALVIGQKSGMVYAVDPDQQGKILWQTRAGEGGVFGGSQWGSAADGENVYVAISGLGLKPMADPKSPRGYRLTLDPKKGGGLSALDLKTGRIVWSTEPAPCAASRTDCSPAQSAPVSAIPGVVFSGSVDGHLRAYSTATGEVLWDTDTATEFEPVNGGPARGGSIDVTGAVVVNGLVFVNSGYGQWGGMPGNVLLAFSVNGK